MTAPILARDVAKYICTALEDRQIYLDTCLTLDGILEKVAKLVPWKRETKTLGTLNP